MKLRSAICQIVFLTSLLTSCFAHHMAVVVDKENLVGNVTSAHLSKIFRAEVKKWADGKSVLLVLHKNSMGESETLKRLTGMSVGARAKLFAEHKDSILWVESDAEVLKAVQAKPGSIGMIDVRSVDGSINVVRVDTKLPTDAGYLPHQ